MLYKDMEWVITSFCASPARRRKELVTSVLVNLLDVSEATRSSVHVAVISNSRVDSRVWGMAITLRGRGDGTSGIGGVTLLTVLSRWLWT